MGMKQEIKHELTQHIIPFWHALRDDENGGFTGYVNYNLQPDKSADKGGILHSRILWFFSSAYISQKEKSLLADAEHAYNFLIERCEDKRLGGIYWSVTSDGQPCDTTKHTYAQAFAVYGLAAYYAASKNETALDKAYELFKIIETKCRDANGYGEAFTADWHQAGNDKLSENGVEAQRTMNTLLHIFEAYAGLYEVTKDKKVADAMRRILDCFLTHVYNPAKHRQEVFFDKQYNPLLDLHSYGHDIEAAWLIDWGCGLLNDNALEQRVHTMTNDLANQILDEAVHSGAVYNECEKGIVDKTQVWWVQAEAVTGFVNAWQKTGKEKYLQAAKDIWNNIKANMIDKRSGSEWFWALDENGNPITSKPIAEPWKCPYHNGRMCMEVIRRL